MLLLALLQGCPSKTGVDVLAVCPDPTVTRAGATVDDGDLYQYCFGTEICPPLAQVDEQAVIDEAGFESARSGCPVDGEMVCGPVTTEAGCCYMLEFELTCIVPG